MSPMKPISPTAVRHIKLGEAGEWEAECLAKGTLRLGFVGAPHAVCMAHEWKTLHAYWRRRKNRQGKRNSRGVASNYVTDIKRFYTDDGSVLWITLHNNFLWWCFSDPTTIRVDPDGTKVRTATTGWRGDDLDGKPLTFGRVSRVVHYRNNPRTICNVKEVDYIVRRINGGGSKAPLIPEEVKPSRTYIEGAVKTIQVNAYERNRKARDECIRHHGMKCGACQIDMASLYGELGKDVIHVHHLKELSSLGKSYRVDPKADLRPVCPNCHAVLHSRSPCIGVEDLRKHLAERQPVMWPGG